MTTTQQISKSATPSQIARKLFVATQVAIVKASGHALADRWVNAIIRAGEAFVAGKDARKEMVEKLEAYNTTNATCDCEAGKHGNPCKHRAFKRLVEKWATE